MKTDVFVGLLAHLAGEVTTVASCWIITRKDGTIFRFTDHDCDMTVATHDYLSASGMGTTDLKQDRTLSVDNMEAMAFLNSEFITDADLRAGLFDGAVVDLFLVNWADTTMGVLRVLRGWLFGRVEIRDDACTVELRGLGSRLATNICDLYSETCRADFGDAQCGVDLAGSGMVQSGSVKQVVDRQQFYAEAGLDMGADDTLPGGILTWSDSAGGNAGLSMEIKATDGAWNQITLFLAMPSDITVGDEFEIVRGCDKTIATCVSTFDNGINFRGEPWVPVSGKTKTAIMNPDKRTPWVR